MCISVDKRILVFVALLPWRARCKHGVCLGTLLVIIATIKRPPGKDKNYPETTQNHTFVVLTRFFPPFCVQSALSPIKPPHPPFTRCIDCSFLLPFLVHMVCMWS